MMTMTTTTTTTMSTGSTTGRIVCRKGRIRSLLVLLMVAFCTTSNNSISNNRLLLVSASSSSAAAPGTTSSSSSLVTTQSDQHSMLQWRSRQRSDRGQQQRQQQELQYPALTTETLPPSPCSSALYSVFSCNNPYGPWIVPCDPVTCLWNLTALSPDAPPALCEFITVNDVNALNIPDAVKPCAAWAILYGEGNSPNPQPTVAPFTAPPSGQPSSSSPTAAPIEPKGPLLDATRTPAKKKQPTASPVVPPSPAPSPGAAAADADTTLENGVYTVSFETVWLNFLVYAPISLATDAFQSKDLLAELQAITERHILLHVRETLFAVDDNNDNGELVVAASAKLSSSVSLPPQAPWKNATVVATQAVKGGTVQFHQDYGQPSAEAVNNMVQSAFRDRAAVQRYLKQFRTASNDMLQRVYALRVGLPSDILPSAVATSTISFAGDTAAATESDQSEIVQWFDSIQWGDWSDPAFIIFVAASGALFLGLCCIFVLCCCCHVRQKRKEQFFLLLHSKSNADTEPVSPTFSNSTPPKYNNSARQHEVDDLEGPPVAVVRQPVGTGTSERFDAADMEQSSQTHLSVDAVMTRRLDDNELDDDDLESSLSNCSHGRSEMTSVYSYIETKSMISVDDNCYSVGGALMYNPHIPGDDQSVGWSVAGGNLTGVGDTTGPDISLMPQAPLPDTPQQSRASGVGSLSRMVSTAASSPDGANIMIFCDGATDDDAISLINDSVLVSTVDYGNDSMRKASPYNRYMSTNSRVAEVVANLEAKAAGSTPPVNYGRPSSRNSSSVDAGSTLDANRPDYRSPSGSTSSPLIADEGDRNSADSESVPSYVTPPYEKGRVSKQTEPDSDLATAFKAINRAVESSSDANDSFVNRSMSTTDGVAMGTSPGNLIDHGNGHHRRQSDSPRKTPQASFVLRSSSFKSWGGKKTAETGSNELESKASQTQQQQASSGKALAFWSKPPSRISKASQLVLNSVNSPGGSSSGYVPSPTETQVSVQSNFTSIQKIAVVEQYQDSESDIQSICSKDDRSIYSFVKSSIATAANPTRGSAVLTKQERSLLGTHRPLATSWDGNDDYILPAAYK